MNLLLARHQGSLEHCYHFWMGYFLPACEWLIDNPDATQIKMVECGPMTHWIEHLKKYRDIQIIKPRTALNFYLDERPAIVFNRCDQPENLKNNTYFSKIDQIKLNFFNKKNNFDTEIAIIDRNKSIPFYLSQESESKGGGSDRRTIKNLSEIKKLFDNVGTTEMIDGTYLTAQQTVDKFSNVKCIVGQFGAGLTNMVWMKPGSVVVEIRPKEKINEVINGDKSYRFICEILGFHYIEIEAQDNWFSNANIEMIRSNLNNIKHLMEKNEKTN